MKPCNRFAVAGYDMFARRCDSGMHSLHIELPHGSVTGSRNGYEHFGHCANLTICRASFEASNVELGDGGSLSVCIDVFEAVFCKGNVVWSGRDIELKVVQQGAFSSLCFSRLRGHDVLSQVLIPFLLGCPNYMCLEEGTLFRGHSIRGSASGWIS